MEIIRRLFELVAGYGLGASSVALFGRVGGGIYTKAADVGSDLVGKNLKDLKEDDPSNPGTIARLKEMGFRFPEFIDYSFDAIVEPEQRFDAVIKEYTTLMMSNMHRLYIDNQDIITHNQRCVQTIPYDTRILKVFDV